MRGFAPPVESRRLSRKILCLMLLWSQTAVVVAFSTRITANDVWSVRPHHGSNKMPIPYWGGSKRTPISRPSSPFLSVCSRRHSLKCRQSTDAGGEFTNDFNKRQQVTIANRTTVSSKDGAANKSGSIELQVHIDIPEDCTVFREFSIGENSTNSTIKKQNQQLMEQGAPTEKDEVNDTVVLGVHAGNTTGQFDCNGKRNDTLRQTDRDVNANDATKSLVENDTESTQYTYSTDTHNVTTNIGKDRYNASSDNGSMLTTETGGGATLGRTGIFHKIMRRRKHAETWTRRAKKYILVYAFKCLESIVRGIGLPFPSLRRILKLVHEQSKKAKGNQKNIALGLSMYEIMAFVLSYLMVGVASYSFIFEKWTIVDSLYFSCTCFSTVGYGDVCPTNAASRIFTCIYGLGGIAVLSTAIATIGSSILQAEVDAIAESERRNRAQAMKLLEDMPDLLKNLKKKKHSPENDYLSQLDNNSTKAAAKGQKGVYKVIQKLRPVGRNHTVTGGYLASLNKGERKRPVKSVQKQTKKWRTRFLDKLSLIRRKAKVRPLSNEYLASIDTTRRKLRTVILKMKRAVYSFVPALLIVLCGGAIMRHLNRSVRLWTWDETIYYAFVTASTIGFGDLGPQTRASKIFAIIFVPLSVAAVGEWISGIAVSIIKRRQRNIYDSQLKRALNVEHLKEMDENGDGKVSREEYTQFMLTEMGIVTKGEFEELHNQFRRLDTNKTGYLDSEDIKLIVKAGEQEVSGNAG